MNFEDFLRCVTLRNPSNFMEFPVLMSATSPAALNTSTPATIKEDRYQITFFKEHLNELRAARKKENKKGIIVVPENTPSAWKKYFSRKKISSGVTIYQSWITSMQKENGMLDKEKASDLCIAMKNAYAELEMAPKYELYVKQIIKNIKTK